MPRLLIPTDFSAPASLPQGAAPALSISNRQGHNISIHPAAEGIWRVAHQLPQERYRQKRNGPEGIAWEDPLPGVEVKKLDAGPAQYSVETSSIRVEVILEANASPRLEWYANEESEPFLRDSQTRAYTYDAATGAVIHYVERESFLPVSEDEDTPTPYGQPFLHDDKNEFVYGFGESRGSIEKSGRTFQMGGRDALAYDGEHGDPLYKYNPFYLVYNKASKRWYGLYYNSLVDATFDTGASHDVLWGCYRSYHASSGPLDYYVLIGDGTLPSVIKSYASLVTPAAVAHSGLSFTSSPTLPPLSQFGYLSCSLSLGSQPDAQEAVGGFLTTCRKEGFPIDGLFLSSGWCQDEESGDRLYYVWNKSRYPSPAAFGRMIEEEHSVQSMMNVKPWFLNNHPFLEDASAANAFVLAAPDATLKSPSGAALTWLWSSGFACHKLGSYFDFSSRSGSEFWKTCIKEHLIKHGLTGVWNDNNEMAGILDDDETFAGEVGMWADKEGTVEKRMGWGGGVTTAGAVGRAVQTMGMARASYEAVMEARPGHRPVVVSRSGVPGIQAYAHSSWSGDNSTTWKALKFSTKMTLSVGLSFGPGLYGHDIGGFAGKHHPSPELLVRWFQQAMYMTRLTENSWKTVATTLWMYKDVPGITDMLRSVLQWRYRLAPTFSSLYVIDYYRSAAPIVKPLLWHHSDDPKTLKLDDEFLFGSHTLVAPVVEKDARTRQIYLPGVSNDGSSELLWCELDTGRWHQGKGEVVELDAQMSRTPTLVRAGGILVLGGVCSRNIFDGTGERDTLIFPAPHKHASGTKGSFTLIEDDGTSNDHTDKGFFTELDLSFVTISTDRVEVAVQTIRHQYVLPYSTMLWLLPSGDERVLVDVEGKILEQVEKDGKRAFVMDLAL